MNDIRPLNVAREVVLSGVLPAPGRLQLLTASLAEDVCVIVG